MCSRNKEEALLILWCTWFSNDYTEHTVIFKYKNQQNKTKLDKTGGKNEKIYFGRDLFCVYFNRPHNIRAFLIRVFLIRFFSETITRQSAVSPELSAMKWKQIHS